MIELSPLDPNTLIKSNDGDIGSVIDFWSWAFSALHVPIPRGYFAEYIVFKSIIDGSDNYFRPPMNYLSTKLEKDEPDLITFLHDDKMTIQVKSIDSIKSKQAFGLGKSHGYNPDTDKNDGYVGHHSYLFVLCFLALDKEAHNQLDNYRLSGCRTDDEKRHCQELQESLNKSVLNLDNWLFYVFPSMTAQNKNSITLSVLENLVAGRKAIKCSYSELHSAIRGFHQLKVNGQICF